MHAVRLAFLAILAWPVPAPTVAQAPEIVVRGDIARVEIERILGADNVDTFKLRPREVADLIAQIPRRRAPQDFWSAYRAHVQAWQRLADATETARHGSVSTDIEAVAEAIDTTFDEVERIARRYGAQLPLPVGRRLPTV
jgi:ubiquinone biosynthesis protein UbiJ